MTATISFDGLTGARNENMGIGGQFTYDKLGPQQVLSFYGSYAYRLQLNDDDDRLSFGLGFGATQYSINIAELQYNDANDPVIPAGSAKKIKPDVNFGIYYSTTDFYVGASALNLSSFTKSKSVYYSDNTQYPSIEKAVQLYLTGGWITDLTDQIKFKPSIMLKEDFKAPTAVDFNSFLLFADRMWIGGSYRRSFQIWHKSNLQPNLDANNAASGIVQFYATPTIRIGYAYDFTTSGLSSYQSGTHEISIGITFPSSKRSELVVDPRYF
jgi:type IX secretion system PorP/SprF family membrane protein